MDTEKKVFDPGILYKTLISLPLLKEIAQTRDSNSKNFGKPIPVIIDLNLRYSGRDAEAGRKRDEAAKKVHRIVDGLKARFPDRFPSSYINSKENQHSEQYLFATLDADLIEELVKADSKIAEGNAALRAIYQIWPDFEVEAFMTRSVSTVKADAARVSFSAMGDNITWAVMDSGIDRNHRHFRQQGNIHADNTYHHDFTTENDPFRDGFGHGTHVAGIIAGESDHTTGPITIVTRVRDERGTITPQLDETVQKIGGMAPRCKLVSLKVLDEAGRGRASNLIAAIAAIQDINGHGRDIKIHGVNMSLGYDFQPEWFACGQSPLCVEVDRLVKSGVVVVVAAGNTGYGITKTLHRGDVPTGLPFSINDPGNAELAITVGSTHRDMPHTYGVSYFSSKGPTGDGRIKPDLVAPGEKIISCATGNKLASAGIPCDYLEDSGTSMAAPHVSGVIAAFLSVRREFIGKPERIKEIFVSTATDLKRDRYFQGNGLIDMMRAIQSV